MKNQILLDCILVPIGLFLMAGYHIWLLYRILKKPTKTVIGINSVYRRIWVQTMMENPTINGIIAVQTLRNNIMASTLLASTAIMLSSVIAILMTRSDDGKNQPTMFPYGDKSSFGFSIKFFSILLCFLLSFLLNVQSIRYYSHASTLINISAKKVSLSPLVPYQITEYVGSAVNRGSYFWSLGLRAFYFSFPLFFWIFGAIYMLLCCVLLVLMLYFLDVAFFEFGGSIVAVEEDEEIEP